MSPNEQDISLLRSFQLLRVPNSINISSLRD
jgi:hypothetical protein